MNGGNKLYLYKDGFGDVYSATPEEEAAWAQDVIDAALATIDTSENSSELMGAIENLRFHRYAGLDLLMVSELENASRERRISFAKALLRTPLYSRGVDALYQDEVQHRNSWTHHLMPVLQDRASNAAKLFILTCVEGDDDALFIQATITLGRWAGSGMPALRQHRLLEILQPENRHHPLFCYAIEQLNYIFQTNPAHHEPARLF